MGQRVVSFVLAALIFGSALLSGVFVYQAIKKEQDASKEADAAAASRSTNTAEQQMSEQVTEDTNATPKEGALQGTQLAGFTPLGDNRITDLLVEDLVVGDGAEVTSSSRIVAHYTGATMKDGIIFESSLDSGQKLDYPLGNLIVGWQEGLVGMKVGGKRRLSIPAAKAYGETGRVSGDLIFEMELFEVK
jgi:peptidylprolyl isomerase